MSLHQRGQSITLYINVSLALSFDIGRGLLDPLQDREQRLLVSFAREMPILLYR